MSSPYAYNAPPINNTSTFSLISLPSVSTEIADTFKNYDEYCNLKKQIESLEQSYIELEKKYCELLKNS